MDNFIYSCGDLDYLMAFGIVMNSLSTFGKFDFYGLRNIISSRFSLLVREQNLVGIYTHLKNNHCG